MKTFYNKIMALVICLVAFGTISNTVIAQNAEVEAYQRSRNEYVFTVQINDRAELQTLTRMASIDGVNGNEVFCYANQKEYDALINAGYELKLVDNRPGRYTFPMWDDSQDYNFDCYLQYGDYVYMMQQYAANHNNCTLISLGSTPGGRELLGVRISPDDTYECPKVLWTGAIHGNEMLSTVMMMKLIDKLLTDNSTEVQELVNNLDIFIFPSLNPDGTYAGGNRSVDGATRSNAYGIDLNRNFPDNVEGIHPDNNDYQPETQMLMNLLDEYQFTLSANYHTGGAVVNYPWDNNTTNHADRNWWEYVCAQYVASARNMGHTLFGNNKTYMRSANNVGDTQAGYVRGCDWYVVYGGVQDYMNYYKGCRSVTVEIYQDGEVENRFNQTYSPTSSTSIAKYVQANIPATMQLMKEALYGIKGFVMDADYNGIEGATITINNHDVNGSEVVTNMRGKYFRPIKAGTYSVTYSAPGYVSQTVNVTVTDGHATAQSVNLQEDDQVITVDFAADVTDIMPGELVHFTNSCAGAGELSYSWSFPGGTPSTSTSDNPYVIYAATGTYDVTLTVTNDAGASETLTKTNYISVTNSFLMHTGSMIIPDGTFSFYDTGGANGNYSDDEEYYLTIYPSSEHSSLSVRFSSFRTEKNYDFLTVYNGPSTSSTVIDTYHGQGNNNNNHTPTNNTVLAPTNPEGALTFKFTSDDQTNYSGWVATVTCVHDPIYTITYEDEYEGGTLAVDPEEAYAGDAINVHAEAEEGYQLIALYYKTSANATDSTMINLNTLTFVMPAHNIIVYAQFSNLPQQTIVNMCNGSCATGNTLFYDSGGEDGYYSNRETYTYTFRPSVEGGLIQAEFSMFNTESRYDKLNIYDGTTTNSAALIGSYSGSNNPGTIISTSGALTFKFTSDNSLTRPGWEALITTVVYTHYNVNIVNQNNYGTVTADQTSVLAGSVVTLTATPANANLYFLADLTITCGDEPIELVNNQFVMPEGDVTVNARFAAGTYHPAYYELITSSADLVAGTHFILANGNDGSVKAMGEQGVSSTWQGGMNYQYSYFREAVDLTVVNNEIHTFTGACDFVFDGFAGQGSFYDAEEDGYLYCYRYKKNNAYTYALNTVANSSYKYWQFVFGEDGAVEIENNAYYRDMGYDAPNNRFDVFTLANNKRMYMFKRIEGYWTENTKGTLAVSEGEVMANVYPNPTTGNITLQAEGMQQISVFNVMGQEVMSLGANSDMETLNLGGLDAGMYLIRIYTTNGVAIKRVNLMH